VLFAKFTVRDGQPILRSALYEPDLSSFAREGARHVLRYKNSHGGNRRLQIAYYTKKHAWEGEKIVNGEIVGAASGDDWHGFCAHLTLLGLANGERCEMESLAQGRK
jgi:hypothetical protein